MAIRIRQLTTYDRIKVESGNMIINKTLLSFLLALIPVAVVPVHAADPYIPGGVEEFEYDDSLDVPWKEDQLTELKPPQDDNLIKVDIDNPPIGFELFIDQSSINVSETDDVIRYWLVFKAKKSRNAFYEGMKCTSREYKTYGYENKWDKTRVNLDKNAKWQSIQTFGHNQFREELRKYYFCSDVLPRPAKDIIDILKGYKSTTSGYDPTYHYAK